jgi:hypothetical protein
MRNMYRTLERNTYLKEKKKQDWLDKAINYEEKKEEQEYKAFLNHQKKLEDIKKKEFYRDTVRKRNNDILEEKKNKTLWRLEKIAVGGSTSLERGKAGSAGGSEDRGGRAYSSSRYN